MLGSALASWNWINALIGGGLRSLTGAAGLLLALAYYTLAGVAGVRLLARKPGADQLAILALLPQLVQIQTGSFLVKIVCGLSIGLLVGGNGVSFSFGAESALAVSIGQTERPTVAFVNLAAAAFLWYFYHQADEAA